MEVYAVGLFVTVAECVEALHMQGSPWKLVESDGPWHKLELGENIMVLYEYTRRGSAKLYKGQRPTVGFVDKAVDDSWVAASCVLHPKGNVRIVI